MSEAKRNNFSTCEKDNLISIILNYKHILENKKKDNSTLGEKEIFWKTITDEFNASSSVPRTVTQLKAFYKNAKSELKKKVAANRASLFRTGGGRHEEHLNEEDPLLSKIIEQTQTVDNPYDSSHQLFSTVDSVGETEYLDGYEMESSIQLTSTSRRKRPREPTRLEEERTEIFKEVMELKKQKLAADIEKSKLKAEVYKAKLAILKNFEDKSSS